MIASWEDETPYATYVKDIAGVEPYESGKFYRRELPCILAVLEMLPSPPETVVVDGYVWLGANGRPGLGARLHEALDGGVPVVGIAKTAFKRVQSCEGVISVLRSASRNPLFITAAGIAPETAAQYVHRMAGKHRIPALLKMTDHLSRSKRVYNCASGQT